MLELSLTTETHNKIAYAKSDSSSTHILLVHCYTEYMAKTSEEEFTSRAVKRNKHTNHSERTKLITGAKYPSACPSCFCVENYADPEPD